MPTSHLTASRRSKDISGNSSHICHASPLGRDKVLLQTDVSRRGADHGGESALHHRPSVLNITPDRHIPWPNLEKQLLVLPWGKGLCFLEALQLQRWFTRFCWERQIQLCNLST